MKVAVIQNSVGIGGRSKVIAETIKLLYNFGSEIALFTFSGKESTSKFLNYFDLDDDRIDIYRPSGVASSLPGTMYEQVGLNWASKRKIDQYDFVFNSNNTHKFLPESPDYLHYFHLPVPAIPEVNERYQSSLLHAAYAAPVQVMYRLYNQQPKKGAVVCNSQFTATQYEEIYKSSPDGVVYPPSVESEDLEDFSGEGVVSLGSFHPNKRQLFQIQVAERLPEIQFKIIGRRTSKEYFDRCNRYIDSQDISNVTLYHDSTDETVKRTLKHSMIFLHSMKNEPFGISTVEAINAGCIPVTHDSGGQREIVPDPHLRYTTVDDCAKIIRKLLSGEYDPDPKLFKKSIKNYTSTEFKSKMQEYISIALSQID